MGDGVRPPRPRPRFELTSDDAPDVVLDRVKHALEDDGSVRGLVLPPSRIELTVPHEDRHVWSPQLTVDVSPANDGSHLRARFGPDPHVWTMYVALYGLSVMVAIGCLMYGVSQWIAQQSPWALYLTPIAFVMAGLVYGASFVGQGLGSEQMYRVRAFLEGAVHEDELAPDSTPDAVPEDAQG